MKHLLFFLIVFPFLASAQILEKQFVATVQYSGFTQINDSLFRGDLIEFRDVLIEGYQPSGVDSGFICLDGTGRSYRIEVINSFDYSSLNVDLIELDNYDEIPIGVGIIAERYGSTYQIPNGLVNSIGISSVLQAKILNHNTKIAATTVQPPDTLYLKEASGVTAVSDGDTIDVSPYLFKSDTASMLLNYPSTVGYGILKSGKTIRADTTSPSGLATRLFARTLPTTIAAGQVAYSNGSNLVGSPNFGFGGGFVGLSGSSASDVGYAITNTNPNKVWVMSVAGSGNGAGSGNLYWIQATNGFSAFGLDGVNKRVIVNGNANLSFATGGDFTLNSVDVGISREGFGIIRINNGISRTTSSTGTLKIPKGTSAQKPTGEFGDFRGLNDDNSYEGYNGLRSFKIPESTFARGTSTYVPYFDANGQMTQTSSFKLTGAANLFANNYFNNAIGGGYYSTDGNQGLLLGSGFNRIQIFGSGTNWLDFYNTNGGVTIFRATTNTRRLSANIAATTISGLTGGDYSVTDQAVLSGGSNGRALTVHGGDADNISAGTTSGNLILRGGRATGAAVNPTQGTILFQTAPNSTSAAEVQRGKITQGGFWNIGTDATPSEELDVNGDARFRDSVRIASTPTHAAITGLLTRDANGWVGRARLGAGLVYDGDSIRVTGGTNIYNSDGTLPENRTIDADGHNLSITNIPELELGGTTGNRIAFYDGDVLEISSDEGTDMNTNLGGRVSTDIKGVELSAWSTIPRTHTHKANLDSASFRVRTSFAAVPTEEVLKVTLTNNADEGNLTLGKYALGQKEATDLSRSQSHYVAGFATDGTVTDFRLNRDTFIQDVTLFAVGTLIQTCQELTIVSSMTGTAPAIQEIRFPQAAEYLRGRKITVYSKKKDPGSFYPEIKVVGGVSELYYTNNPVIGGTNPSDSASFPIDNVNWSAQGKTYQFTCSRINSTDYRWVLTQ